MIWSSEALGPEPWDEEAWGNDYDRSIVYALYRSPGRYFYVGVTSKPLMRLREHRWYRTGGVRNPKMHILEIVPFSRYDPDRYKAERSWIRKLRSLGHRLVNKRKPSRRILEKLK